MGLGNTQSNDVIWFMGRAEFHNAKRFSLGKIRDGMEYFLYSQRFHTTRYEKV